MAEVQDNGMTSSRDYEIQSLEIINSAGKSVSVEPQFVELQWHQGIEENVMHGTVVLTDAQDIIGAFFICGNEKLVVKLDQPSLGYPLSREFRITKITNRASNGGSGANYVIHFVSGEALDTNSKAISKAYKGMRYSDIAKDILQNYMKANKINRIDFTTGAHDVIIPGFRPIEALNWIASRSYNGTDSTSFFFFENREGFEFVSLKSLYTQKVAKSMTYDIKSVNDTPNSPTDVKKNRDSIEKLQILQDFDILSASRGLASSLTTVNIFNREIKQFNYSLANMQNNLLNKNLPTNDKSLMETYSANYKTHVLVGDTKSEKENAVDKWLMPRQMHNTMITNSLMLRAESALDISVKAGDLIKIDFPKFIAADEKGKELDTFRAGKYLVHSVSHVFKQIDSRLIGSTIMILVSDSLAAPLPTEQRSKT